MKKRPTAGEQSLKAASDFTKYDMLEVGEALTNDILREVWKCIDKHYDVIDEPEFCVIMVRASDPLIKGIMRKKYYAWPYLPKPRPEQVVFLYNKVRDDIIRLWSLPGAKVMAVMSEMNNVADQWKLTKFWCDAFYTPRFHEYIRAQHRIKLESEHEYLNTHRAELIKAGCNEGSSVDADAFDFSKITVNQVVKTDVVGSS